MHLSTVHVQREKKTYCFVEYLIQDMRKEKNIEAFANYVLATYVDDTVLKLYLPEELPVMEQKHSTGIIMNYFMHFILQCVSCEVQLQATTYIKWRKTHAAAEGRKYVSEKETFVV